MEEPKIPGGFILMARLLLESPLWSTEPHTTKLFIYLVATARHEVNPKRFFGLEVKRGELITSLSSISENCPYEEYGVLKYWSRSKVYRMLQKLAENKSIEILDDAKGTHIKIVNFDFYQNPDNYKVPNRSETAEKPIPAPLPEDQVDGAPNKDETEMKRRRNEDETEVKTYNNDKNEKNVKNEKKITSLVVSLESKKLVENYANHRIDWEPGYITKSSIATSERQCQRILDRGLASVAELQAAIDTLVREGRSALYTPKPGNFFDPAENDTSKWREWVAKSKDPNYIPVSRRFNSGNGSQPRLENADNPKHINFYKQQVVGMTRFSPEYNAVVRKVGFDPYHLPAQHNRTFEQCVDLALQYYAIHRGEYEQAE